MPLLNPAVPVPSCSEGDANPVPVPRSAHPASARVLVRREGGGLGRREELLFLAALLTYAMVIFKNRICTFSMESVRPPVSAEAYIECSRETHREVLQK